MDVYITLESVDCSSMQLFSGICRGHLAYYKMIMQKSCMVEEVILTTMTMLGIMYCGGYCPGISS